MQDHPPVAELVAEAFDQQRAVGGQVAGGRLLFRDELRQIVSGERIQAEAFGVVGHLVRAAELADELTDGGSEFGGSADAVTVPERQPARLAVRRGDQHPVVRDLLDPPAGRAQGEDVTHPGLVDHLLVQFAHPRLLFAHHVDGEQPAVRDRAARGDRQTLSAGTSGDRALGAVPDHSRSQFGELVGRVTA